MRKLLFFIFFVIFHISTFSQDLIIKLDSSKILCNILRVDDFIIQYKISNEKGVFTNFIDRKEVLRYYLSDNKIIAEKGIVKYKKGKDKGKEFSKILINAGFGLSIPVNDFASHSSMSALSGHARDGISASSGFAIMFNQFIGLDISYTFFRNSFNESSMAQRQFFFNENSSFSDIQPWRVHALSLGAYVSIPILFKQKLSLDITPSINISNVTSIGFVYLFRDGYYNNVYRYNVLPSSAYAVGFGLKGGLRYKISKSISVSAISSFYGSEADFKNEFFTYGFPNILREGLWIYDNRIGGKQKINVINHFLGLTYSFN